MFHSVGLLSQAPLARGSCALPSVLFKMYPYDEQVQDRRINHTFKSLVASNTTVQVFEMIKLQKNYNSNISTACLKYTTNILITNKRKYAYQS